MSESKDTNPKDAVGVAKTPFSTMSMPVLAELGLVMMEGALKYGRHNYRAVGVRASVYLDAAMRHLVRFWEGEEIDPDSGMPHLVHAMACCLVLRDSQIQGNWTDDRPPKSPDNWMVGLSEHAADLLKRYPNPVPAYTQLKQSKQPRQWNSLNEVPRDVRVISANGCIWKFWHPGEQHPHGHTPVSPSNEKGVWLYDSHFCNWDKTPPFTKVTETNDSVT